MTTAQAIAPARAAGRQALSDRFDRIKRSLDVVGLGALVTLARLATLDFSKATLREAGITLLAPVAGILIFLSLWASLAPRVETSLGAIPGPAAVWSQAGALWEDHLAEREKAREFQIRVEARNAELIAAGRADLVRERTYTGRPTFVDQIFTSLKTVALGFFVATLVAVPLGILCGLSAAVNGALNPLIQIFKPVSPLAWLPIVTMVVSALYVDPFEALPKALVVSAITVTLCSLWPTLINTALGVASIDKDLVNVGRVLQLSTATTIRKLVLPSALPLIFTGLRLSLGVGWMVLIAAEMLAQNPGLGKFVWDEFQNGSSSSLARIIVAVLTIGLIGFLLDRVMVALQAAFTVAGKR